MGKGLALLATDVCHMTYVAVFLWQVAPSNAEFELVKLADLNTSADRETVSRRYELRRVVSAGRKCLHESLMHMLPPSIAIIDGLVTEECRIGVLVGLDTLHVSAESTNRKLADALCEIFLYKG